MFLLYCYYYCFFYIVIVIFIFIIVITNGHVVHLPSVDQHEEQESQHEVTHVAEDVVEGTENAQRRGTEEVIIAQILVPRCVQHLQHKTNSTLKSSSFTILVVI